MTRTSCSVSRAERAARSGRRLRGSDRGFTVVETVIALALVSGVLLGVERGVNVAGSAGAFAQQHSTAVNLLNADIAQIESMPFVDVQAGLNPNAGADPQFSRDSNIVTGGSTGYELRLNSQSIPVSNSATSQPPLVPHIGNVSDGIEYNVATYPTTAASMPGIVTVTVVVSWLAANNKTATVTGETEIGLP